MLRTLTLERFVGRVSWEPWRRVVMRDVCVYCGAAPTGLDHITPASRGGPNHWTNRAPACDDCNHAKDNTGLLMFLCVSQHVTGRSAVRQYRLAEERQVAIDLMRARIAATFYKGNINQSVVYRRVQGA